MNAATKRQKIVEVKVEKVEKVDKQFIQRTPKNASQRYKYVFGRPKQCFNPGCHNFYLPNGNRFRFFKTRAGSIIKKLFGDNGTLANWWETLFCSEFCGLRYFDQAPKISSVPRAVTTFFKHR